MARSVNKVILIGNIVKDPLVKNTNAGKYYCVFTIATNRNWMTEHGEKKEETEFHRIIVWDKLGEMLAQFGQKGKKIYLEGRLQTRSFKDKTDAPRSVTEIIATDVVFLDQKQKGGDNNGRPTNGGNRSTNAAGQIS